jgi:SET domain-containing protein
LPAGASCLFRPGDMPANAHIPRLNLKAARFKLAIRRSRIERYGVFAGETILRGRRVIEYTGERISNREVTRRTIERFVEQKEGRVYIVRLDGRSMVDGAVGGSGAEFINHSCDPNLSMRKIRGQIFLYSFRKIRAGEELTVDYGLHCSCACRCGSGKCRGTMCGLA